ncbi:MAG: hypothetical protein HY966_04350 [Ignavibacteriales bacterium]|nr:hypothetical protein [Ignavibacteriales bacterium]
MNLRASISPILLILFCASNTRADSPSSAGAAGAAMRLGFAARGMGLGNAMTAVLSGELAGYYNPAATSFESTPTVSAAYSFLSLDRRLNFVSYTRHLKPIAGLSLWAINAGVGSIEGRDRDGRLVDTYSTSENQFGLSFGLNPYSQFSFGVTAKILYYHLFDKINSSTVSIDLGVVYRLSDQLTAAVVVQDIGSKYKWDTNRLYGKLGNVTIDEFPLRTRIGLSYQESTLGLLFSGEFEQIGSDNYVRCGIEYFLMDAFQVRAGIDQISPAQRVDARPSVGLSFVGNLASNWKPVFHYAYVFEPYSPGGIHVLSLSVRFE